VRVLTHAHPTSEKGCDLFIVVLTSNDRQRPYN